MLIQDILFLCIGLFFHLIGKNSIFTGIILSNLIILVMRYIATNTTKESFNKMQYYPVLSNPEIIEFKNSVLHGSQNPKTLQQPPIIPPLGDLDHWKANEYTTHSHINARTVQENQNLLNDPYITTNDWLTTNGTSNKFPLSDADTYKHTPKCIKETFISELQPNIYTDNIPQPILTGLGLVDETPQRYTVLTTPAMYDVKTGKGYIDDKYQMYVETPFSPSVSKSNGNYKTLDTAYNLPNRRHNESFSELTPREELSQYYMKSKIDMLDYDQTAPLYKINPEAVKTHIDVTNRFRSNMQETMMRKRNAEAWQKRMYPLDTNQRRMLGGTRIN